MTNQITGRLYSATATQQKTDRFSVRTFVLEMTTEANGQTYTNYAELQLVNNNCQLLNQFQKGQLVTVNFDVRGSMWQAPSGETKCITNLNAWKITPVQAPAPQQPPQQQQWGQPAPQTQAAPPQQWGQPAQPQQPAQQQWGQPAPQQQSPYTLNSDEDDLPF